MPTIGTYLRGKYGKTEANVIKEKLDTQNGLMLMNYVRLLHLKLYHSFVVSEKERIWC